MDFAFLALTVAFSLVTVVLAYGCEKLRGRS